MKSFKKFLFSFIWILLSIVCSQVIVGCSQDEYYNESYENLEKSEIGEMISYLAKNYGFSVNDINVEDSTLIAEKDIVFDINDFWNKYSVTSTRAHYARTSYVQPAYRNIYISIFQTAPFQVPIEWQIAILRAIDAWNSLGGGIHFTINPSTNYGATISIGYGSGNLDSSVAAKASFPSSGRPGSTIVINANFSDLNNLSEYNRTWIMIHEIGHAIGLCHSDQISSSSFLIPVGDANTDDFFSVMHYTILYNATPPYFTQYDIDSYLYLYP